MSFRKGQSICVFHTQIKITKRGKNIMNIAQFFITLHYYVQILHLLHFRVKFACPCIPKLCFTSGCESIDFSLYTNFQNPIAWFIGLNVLCFFHRTQRPVLYASKDYNVFCLMFSKTTMSSVFYIFKDYNVFSLLHFQRLQSLQSFTFSKTSMSSVFYAFKDYIVFYFMIPRLQCLLLYDFKDYNVFSLLRFQRLQCLQSFMLSETTMSSVIYAFKDYNVFSHLRFQRL